MAQPFLTQTITVGDAQALSVLTRDALAAPTRYQAIVIPGSGCGGMAPIADRYFAGLLHARINVLTKPWVDPAAWPAPMVCSDQFIARDSLKDWLSLAQQTLDRLAAADPALPIVLIGISEGAELLPALAAGRANVSLLVLIGSPGLDPADVAARQFARLGAADQWAALTTKSQSASPDTSIVHGRQLRYWRELIDWHVAEPLMTSGIPKLMAWGMQDALIPPAAFAESAQRWADVPAQLCTMAFDDADHGLQSAKRDGLPLVWAQVELAQRSHFANWCTQRGRIE